MRRKVTLHDVARAANVSPATVSRVVKGSAGVNPEIRQRVKNAAAELGFNLLRSNKTNVIAFLLGNRKLLHPFHSRVLAGAEAYCAAHDYNVLFLSFGYPADQAWQKLHLPGILQRRDLVSGFIVSGTNTQNLLDLLTFKQVPFVVMGNNVLGAWREKECDAVWFDDVQGAYEMTRHLQSLGHRDIWFVGNLKLSWFARLYEGYCRAMAEAALTPRLEGFDSESQEDIGYLAAKSLVGRREPVSAIFAGGDRCAQGVYKGLRDLKLRVPEDISVAGCDDIEGALLHPALTTIRVFTEEIGRHLSELLLNRITHPDLPPQQCIIPTQLVKRQSTQPYSSSQETARAKRTLP